MKKFFFALALASLVCNFAFAQKRSALKRVNVTAKTIASKSAGKAYTLDLTRAGKIYNLDAGIDYNRIRVHTAKGDMTMTELLKKTGKSVSGRLRVGMTSDIRAQKLNLARISGGTLNYNCEGILCTCTGDDDCNDLFTNGGCGDIAMCDEQGCWCFRI